MRRIPLLALAVLAASCSIDRIATNKLADALSSSGTSYARDDDPELVRAAAPFSLKLMETVLESTPEHEELLVATSQGFTQFSWAFVQQDAERVQDESLARADELRERARRLYRRALAYGMRALEVRHPGFTAELRADRAACVAQCDVEDVPALYWTAAAWGALLALSKDDPETLADQPLVQALADRALELDESWHAGAIHVFLIAYESSRPGGARDWKQRATAHFERAVELSGGDSAAPYVALAESVALAELDRARFDALLAQALAIDVDRAPDRRLENLVYQERARWLLSLSPDLFPDEGFEPELEASTPRS